MGWWLWAVQYNELVFDLTEPVPVSAIAILATVGPCTPRELYLYTGETPERVNDFHVSLEIPKLRQWRTLDFPVHQISATWFCTLRSHTRCVVLRNRCVWRSIGNCGSWGHTATRHA
jgi:hypothetical protein